MKTICLIVLLLTCLPYASFAAGSEPSAGVRACVAGLLDMQAPAPDWESDLSADQRFMLLSDPDKLPPSD